MRLSFAAIAACLLLPSCHRTVYLPPYHFVSAESRELRTDHLSDATRIERMLSRASTGDTSEHEIASSRVEERVGYDSGGATFLLVRRGRYLGGDYYDSLVVRRANLRPIREHLSYSERHIDKQLDFHGTSVQETSTIGDSTRTFRREHTIPLFAYAEIEMLVRSLPFHPYYSAILPLYSECGDSLEMDSVYVINDHPGRLWTVRFANPAIVSVYGIEASTRKIVSHNVTSRRTRDRRWTIYGAP